jgi:sulfofructose kinase
MQPTEPHQDHILVSGFGSTVVDILMMAGETITLQNKNPVFRQTIQIGGVIPTALVVLARLGIKTELHTLVGDDMLGTSIQSILSLEHVSIAHAVHMKAPMPLACVIIHHDTGQRTSFYTTGEFATFRDPALVKSLNPKARYLMVDGHNTSMTHEFIQKAKAQQTKVLLDLGNPKDGLDSLIAEADAIIIPKAYWKTLKEGSPETIVRHFLTLGPTLVVLTMEEKGCIVGTKETLIYQPSYKVTAIDTNGAGDVFFGSFTYGLLRDWSLEKAAHFASAAAARSCGIFGKDQKIPRSEEEVYTFIKTHELLQ